MQAPLARFGDTAANAGTLALLDDMEATRTLPVALKTGARGRHVTSCQARDADAPVCAPAGAASVAAGGFRILLMPIDACKVRLFRM